MKLLTSRLSSGALYNNPGASCLSVITLHLLTWNSANRRIMNVISSVWYSNQPLTYLWFAEILTADIISWWQGWRLQRLQEWDANSIQPKRFCCPNSNLTRGTIICEQNPGSVHYSQSNTMRKTNKCDVPARQSCGWRSFVKEVQRCWLWTCSCSLQRVESFLYWNDACDLVTPASSLITSHANFHVHRINNSCPLT